MMQCRNQHALSKDASSRHQEGQVECVHLYCTKASSCEEKPGYLRNAEDMAEILLLA